MVHPVQVGKRTRMSFAKVKDVTEMPNLIEVQLDSYEWFLREGLLEVFDDVNPISNFTGNLVLEFVDYKLDMDNIKYDVETDVKYHRHNMRLKAAGDIKAE